MATHKSAVKRHKQSLKRRDRNKSAKNTIRTAIKNVKAAVDAGDKKLAADLLKKTESLIASGKTKGLFHRKNASRKISRVASYVAAKAK